MHCRRFCAHTFANWTRTALSMTIPHRFVAFWTMKAELHMHLTSIRPIQTRQRLQMGLASNSDPRPCHRHWRTLSRTNRGATTPRPRNSCRLTLTMKSARLWSRPSGDVPTRAPVMLSTVGRTPGITSIITPPACQPSCPTSARLPTLPPTPSPTSNWLLSLPGT